MPEMRTCESHTQAWAGVAATSVEAVAAPATAAAMASRARSLILISVRVTCPRWPVRGSLSSRAGPAAAGSVNQPAGGRADRRDGGKTLRAQPPGSIPPAVPASWRRLQVGVPDEIIGEAAAPGEIVGEGARVPPASLGIAQFVRFGELVDGGAQVPVHDLGI